MLDWYIFKKDIKRYFFTILKVVIVVFLVNELSTCSQTVHSGLALLKQPIYHALFSKQREKVPLQSMQEIYTPYQDASPKSHMYINGYDIIKTFVMTYQGYGRVGYMDVNDALIKGWYLSSMNKIYAREYKAIATHDLLVVFGQAAQPDVFKKLTFSHEENLGIVSWPYEMRHMQPDFSNIHVISATRNVQKGVSVLRKGDEVYMEGLLMDWGGTIQNPKRELYYKTARSGHDISEQRAGGQLSGLCLQLYLTKLIVNGHVYQ